MQSHISLAVGRHRLFESGAVRVGGTLIPARPGLMIFESGPVTGLLSIFMIGTAGLFGQFGLPVRDALGDRRPVWCLSVVGVGQLSALRSSLRSM